MKFIKYQIMRSCGLHLEYIYNLVIIYAISTIDNRLSVLLLPALFLEIIVFELYSYRKFKNDKEKTSYDIIIDNDTIMHKIEKLEVNYIHLEKGQEELKKQIEKGQKEIISQNIEILEKLTIK